MWIRGVPGQNRCCGRKWCVNDLCGVACGFFAWFLLSYGQFCVLTIMLYSSGDNIFHQLLNLILFEIFFVMAFSSHIQTMLTDPGSVPKNTLTTENFNHLEQRNNEQTNLGTEAYIPQTIINKCTKCSCVRPERAHHCSVCQRCIKRMDHHCPWVNNCVGENNQKFFVLFTFYVAILSAQTLYWAIWQFVLCVNNDWNHCSYFTPPTTTILLIFLLFESILFSIFTAVMFGTQLTAICSDETGIESLKQHHYDVESPFKEGATTKVIVNNRWKNLQVVFGGPFSWRWLNPFAIPFISEKAFEFSV